ncbi:extracellular solute-binding protein [Neobacillus drentensis]|uniref:extracellular solute-binding protein n=1 Tax=Neobacillus drentensis TaxID=220684 RepID=UPI003000B14C
MKKLLLLLFSVLMIFTAACSKDSADTAAKKTKDGKTVIRVVAKDDAPSNPASVKYYDELAKALKKDENLNVEFKLVEVPQGTYAEKLNLLLSSGDIPDLIYFQGGDQQMAQQDLLEDLTPYIDKSKYIKDIIQPHNKERLKNYPYLLWIKPLDQKTPVIRKDWFDKMASSKDLMADPTPDNYYKFLKELVTNPPGGAKKPAYALTAAGDMAEIDAIFKMAFGINQTWLKNDGKFEYYKVSKQQKELLAYYQKLYKEGILDPQYLTKQWDTKEKAFYDGEAAVITGTNGKVIDLYNSKMTEVNGKQAQLVVLPAAKGEFQGYGATDITKESRGYAISSQSKNKDVVFKVLDYLASPKGQMLDRLGYAGEEYNVVDNKIELTDKYYSEWYARYWEPTNYQPETPLKTPLLSEPASQSQQAVQQYYTKDNSFIIPEKFVTNWDAMENLYKEYSTDIITGKRPVSDFDKFVQEWKKAGGDDVTKYANENIK